MKLGLVLLILLGVVIMLFLARRRIWTALKLAAGAFVALNVYRFIEARDQTENFITLGLALGAFGAVWLLLWTITKLVERHRRLHPPPPRPPVRRQRWRL